MRQLNYSSMNEMLTSMRFSLDMDPSKTTNNRFQSYKNHGKDAEELRRRRNQYNVSLRKVIHSNDLRQRMNGYFSRLD